jgi:hypothetical protein
MAGVGFECIVDAGLGRTAADFDRYRVSVFDHVRPIDKHFESMSDEPPDTPVTANEAYRRLEAEIGSCGMAQIAGASVAVPYVSALAAAIAIARLISLTSNCDCSRSEVGRVSSIASRKLAPASEIRVRSASHAGTPVHSGT